VLGFPLYGYNWPIATAGTCPAGQEVGKTSVTAASVDDLLQRRSATPAYDAETGEWSFTYQLEITDGATSCTQTREVHYVDGDGARLRIELARRAHLGGVALWALGFDDDAAWDAFDTVVRPAGRVALTTVSSTPS
jgi:spore germination protein YaaH